ncbi:uncharacterized protein N0V89_009959 [Didymosphaeria variabile]|uniref:Uncharacterized protein n=1 Tax=Didymosphaeria variabile TaxID=1932322 RepID=A0A9W9C7T9_9PLEO|nr:uncharacterized protein N0V89_009959 [Didymosphaeria variabile]KAJ4348581.1 hypothetical protein N0V89_009959 [Didymosphaeria variabile]
MAALHVRYHIWTPKRDLLLLRMREGPGDYTWQETSDNLGPNFRKSGAKHRYIRLQKGIVGTDPWDERKERELLRLLAAGYDENTIHNKMRLNFHLIRRRIAAIKENEEQAALQVKQRRFLDKPLRWGGREDEVLLRLHLALMEPTDIQLLGLFGNPALDVVRERIALHSELPTRSELYHGLLEIYNRRSENSRGSYQRVTRWTIEDVLNGHFEFLTPLPTAEEQAADESRRRCLYEKPQEWTIQEDEVLLRFFLAKMEPSTMDRMGLFGKPGQTFIRDRIARHYIAPTPLCATLHHEYNDPATKWTSQDVLHLNFDFKTESTTPNDQDNESSAETTLMDDSRLRT